MFVAARTGTITMGTQHYPHRSQSVNEESAYASLPAELTSFTSSTFEPRHKRHHNHHHHHQEMIKSASSPNEHAAMVAQQRLVRLNENLEFANRRKIGSTDVFGQNMENLVQLEDPIKRKFAKSLDEIREESVHGICGVRRQVRSSLSMENGEMEKFAGSSSCRKDEREIARNAVRRNQSFDHAKYPHIGLDSRTYDIRSDFLFRAREQQQQNGIDLSRLGSVEQEIGYETSDDESCDLENGDFDDTMSSCKSRSRSCCSVTTVANDDFEFFQRKGTKVIIPLI